MDTFSVKRRSEIMANIKSKNTKPELKMAEALKSSNIEFSMHADIIGKPDFVIAGMGIILFVDGEFWHGHTLTERKRSVMTDYWVKKIDRNMERDKEVTAALKKMGWAVIRVTDRDVNKRVKWVISKIWRSHGQLVGGRRRMNPDARIAALRDTLIKNNTKCKKIKKPRQARPKQAA